MTDPAFEESQTVWPGHNQAWVLTWLKANNIDGNDVSASHTVTVAAGEIRYTKFLRSAESGRIYADPATEEPAVTTEVAPLLAPFKATTPKDSTCPNP